MNNLMIALQPFITNRTAVEAVLKEYLEAEVERRTERVREMYESASEYSLEQKKQLDEIAQLKAKHRQELEEQTRVTDMQWARADRLEEKLEQIRRMIDD